MKHILKVPGFELILEIQKKQITYDEYEYDCEMWIAVKSDGFSGRIFTGTSRYSMKQFGGELRELYQTLQGKAQLCDFLEDEYNIEFCGDGKGHIAINGEIDTQWSIPHHHVFRFENEVDQTQFLKFVEDICREWQVTDAEIIAQDKK